MTPPIPDSLETRLDRMGAKLSAGPSVVDAVMRRIQADEAAPAADRRRQVRLRSWPGLFLTGATALMLCLLHFGNVYLGSRRQNVVVQAPPAGPSATLPMGQAGGVPNHEFSSFGHSMFDPFPDQEEVLLKGSKWGFINTTGAVVIEPQFERAGPFREGRAAVKLNGKWGYAGPDGKVIIVAQYQEAREFSEGRAAVKTPKGWAYLDTRGMVVAGPGFEVAEPFHEGMALVKTGGKYGFIDSAGVQVIPPKYNWALRFSEGIASVRAEENGPMVYVDPAGRTVLDPKVDTAFAFSEGRAAVRVGEKWGFIDRTGQWVVQPQYDQVCWTGGFRDGVCMVKLNKKHGYIDRTGAVVIPIKYWEAWPFSEGLAHVEEKNDETGDWGYIDTGGRLVFAQKRASTQCSNGLIRMQVDDGYAFLDRTGKQVIPRLEYATDFSEGVAPFAVNTNREEVRRRLEEIMKRRQF